MRLLDLFRRTAHPDGGSATLEAIATGISPADLDAAEPGMPAPRRERTAEPGSAVVSEALAQKVMLGWLQNRHQVLVPLSLNLRTLSAEQRDTVAGLLAALLLAGRPAGDVAAAVPDLRSWLSGLGADDGTVAAFDAAIASPPPLNVILDRAQSQDLAVTAYVAGLVASDTRYPSTALICDLVQARFDLSNAIVRSATRRYRR